MEASTTRAFDDICSESMESIWQRSPYDFQRQAISHIIKMQCGDNQPQATLLVQGTGGGKSAVYQAVGTVDAGVTLVIETTLSLGADQSSKISSASGINGPVESFQLDSLKSKSSRTSLNQYLRSLEKSTNTSIFLFTSPEELLKFPWTSLMLHLSNNGLLKLICIDEVHQFVTFGTSFRRKFCALKKSLFQNIVDNKSINNEPDQLPTILKTPILFMTATFTLSLLHLLQKMVGIRVLPSNFFWCGKKGMEKQTISINIISSSQPLRVIKKFLSSTLKDNLHKKCIVYANSATALESIKDSTDAWLDQENPFPGDTLLITGSIEPELKLAYTQAFCTVIAEDHVIDENIFFPRILFATAGCIGAGLDCTNVFSVIRVGFPSSIIDLIQEMGRCGRCRQNDGSNPSDLFILILNLNDYIYMNERIFSKDSKPDDETPNTIKLSEAVITKEEQMEAQRNDLLHVLKFLMLNKNTCLHEQLELITASPMEPYTSRYKCNPCGGACPVCINSFSNYIVPVKKSGIQSFLCEVFIKSSSENIDGNVILNKLQNFPNVGVDIYGRPKSQHAPDRKYLHSTILQLIAAELIILNCSIEQPTATMSLGITGTTPSYTLDANWENITLIE